jgi:hypothetical protein
VQSVLKPGPLALKTPCWESSERKEVPWGLQFAGTACCGTEMKITSSNRCIAPGADHLVSIISILSMCSKHIQSWAEYSALNSQIAEKLMQYTCVLSLVDRSSSWSQACSPRFGRELLTVTEGTSTPPRASRGKHGGRNWNADCCFSLRSALLCGSSKASSLS